MVAKSQGREETTLSANDFFSLDTLLGEPPLLPGESVEDYLALGKRLREAIKPTDIFEEMAVRDVQDCAWDGARLRRYETQLLTTFAHEGLEALLRDRRVSNAGDLARGFARRNKLDTDLANAHLRRAGLTLDAAYARTLFPMLEPIERLQRMGEQLEARRTLVLRDIGRRRARRLEVFQRALDAELDRAPEAEPSSKERAHAAE